MGHTDSRILQQMLDDCYATTPEVCAIGRVGDKCANMATVIFYSSSAGGLYMIGCADCAAKERFPDNVEAQWVDGRWRGVRDANV